MERSRRQFLLGGLKRLNRAKKEASRKKETTLEFLLRPPGAIAEKAFLQTCNKECLQCLTACPFHAIQKVGDSLSPAYLTAYIDPDISGCSFCKDFPCIEACGYGALSAEIGPLSRAVVTASCLTRQGEFCEICMTSCPPDHQSITKDKKGIFRIDPKTCVGCGSCVSACYLTPKAIEIHPTDRQVP